MKRKRRRWLPRLRNKISELDITPQETTEFQLIKSYGSGSFHIAADIYKGSVLVFPKRTLAWPVSEVQDISMGSLSPVALQEPSVEILLIGCGSNFSAPLKGLRDGLSEWGMALEWMDTGAASRTFNVLMAEGRYCAAALISVN